jgi:hypothetical protein
VNLGVIKLSGWTQCRTICSPWEFYYSHVHSSVSYNMFTLRVLLLPCSQFSVVQYVHPASFITPRFTVQCYCFFAALSTISALHWTVNMGVIQLSGWTYCTTQNCELGSNKTQSEHIVRHWTVTMGVIKLSRWTYYTTLNCEYGSNKTLQVNTCTWIVLLLPYSQFSVVQCVHPESFITPMFTVQCRTICSPCEFYYS